jgi:hypothetical protein
VDNLLNIHLQEANIHISRIQSIIPYLKKIYPLNENIFNNMSLENQDKLDVLAFRFSKLQDLLGAKIFREYLGFIQYPIEDKGFMELLKELEKRV